MLNLQLLAKIKLFINILSMSLYHAPGDWPLRHVSLLGIAKSFVSQLSIGQDLSKMSMPAAFLYPYSALELGAVRAVTYIDLLLQASRESDPTERLLQIVRYFLTRTPKEKLEKKPYNPLLSEYHVCWTDSKEFGTSVYIAEQYSHHPPMSAYVIENKQEKVRVQVNVTFATKFHGNSASVGVQGVEKIQLLNHEEEYILSRPLPDMWVKNVILGTKRLSWEGELTISCPKTGLKAVLILKEEGWYCYNVAYACICKIDSQPNFPTGVIANPPVVVPPTPLYSINGVCSELFTIAKGETPDQKQTFIDLRKCTPQTLQYLPESEWDERNSLKIWREVGKAVIIDDLSSADVYKRNIEEAQRKRRRENTNWQPAHFVPDTSTNFWHVKQENVELFFMKREQIMNATNTSSDQQTCNNTNTDTSSKSNNDSTTTGLEDKLQQVQISETTASTSASDPLSAQQ